MDGGRESPTSSPAPGAFEDHLNEDEDMERQGEALPVPVSEDQHFRYVVREHREGVEAVSDSQAGSSQQVPVSRSPESRETVSGSYPNGDGSSDQIAAPSNSGISNEFDLDEGGPLCSRQQASRCTPSSSGSLMSSSLQSLQLPQNSELSLDPMFTVEPVDNVSSYIIQPSFLNTSPVSSWTGRIDRPISSCWIDDSPDWTRNPYLGAANQSHPYRDPFPPPPPGSSREDLQSVPFPESEGALEGRRPAQQLGRSDNTGTSRRQFADASDAALRDGTEQRKQLDVREGGELQEFPVGEESPANRQQHPEGDRDVFAGEEEWRNRVSLLLPQRYAEASLDHLTMKSSSSLPAQRPGSIRPVSTAAAPASTSYRTNSSVLTLTSSRSFPVSACSSRERGASLGSNTVSSPSNRNGPRLEASLSSINLQPSSSVSSGSVFFQHSSSDDSNGIFRTNSYSRLNARVDSSDSTPYSRIPTLSSSEIAGPSSRFDGVSDSVNGDAALGIGSSGVLADQEDIFRQNDRSTEPVPDEGALAPASSESTTKFSPSTSSNVIQSSCLAGPSGVSRTNPSKRNLSFPDSPQVHESKRCRLMESEMIRPDSPSDQAYVPSRAPQPSAGLDAVDLLQPSGGSPTRGSSVHRVDRLPTSEQRRDDGSDHPRPGSSRQSDGAVHRATGLGLLGQRIEQSSNPLVGQGSAHYGGERPSSRTNGEEEGPSSAPGSVEDNPDNVRMSAGSSRQPDPRGLHEDPSSVEVVRAGSSMEDRGDDVHQGYGNECSASGSSWDRVDASGSGWDRVDAGPSSGGGERNGAGRVGSTDSVVPSPALDPDWEIGPSLVSGSDFTSHRQLVSRQGRTISESSEAEGTVTYNRELHMVPLHINTNQPGEGVQQVSPSGSEMSEAGPSNQDIRNRQATPASPSESDISVAESSHNRITDHSNPNSPSGSDLDEAGPSYQRGWMAEYGREAAPAPRRPSPEPYRYRSRARYSEQCAISSSTGPADSNPPTPEYVSTGDIDNDIPSPPRSRYRNTDDENVVDSTVDSTSGVFMIPSPVFMGNEAEHGGEDSDSDINDSESIPGSEASSTTASLNEQNFNMPGFDDNEGISTSGQVDNGTFRLVPNEGEEVEEDEDEPDSDQVPDLQQASGSADESVSLPEPQQRNTFKKPFNRKGRLLDNLDQEPMPGPSHSNHDERQPPHNSLPSFNQGSISLTLVSSDSTPAPSVSQPSRPPSVSLFPLKDPQMTSNSKGPGKKSSGNIVDVMSDCSCSDILGIGRAFSGLPNSLSVATEGDSSRPPDKQISGPLSKRLRTRHLQEVAQAEKDDGGSVPKQAVEIVVKTGEQEKKAPEVQIERRPPPVSIVPISEPGTDTHTEDQQDASRPGTSGENSGFNNVILIRNSEPSVSGGEEDQLQAAEHMEPVGDAERGTESDNSFFLGGTQQSFNLQIEPANISLSAIKPKKFMRDKIAGSPCEAYDKSASSEYRELFDFEHTLKHDSSDLPLIITDAINDVDINAEESIEIFTDADKVISESVSKLIKEHSEKEESLQYANDEKVAPASDKEEANTTLPKVLRLQRVTEEREGVVAVEHVPPGTRFGPISTGGSQSVQQWMNSIRCVSNPAEENIAFTRDKDEVCLITNRELQPGEELVILKPGSVSLSRPQKSSENPVVENPAVLAPRHPSPSTYSSVSSGEQAGQAVQGEPRPASQQESAQSQSFNRTVCSAEQPSLSEFTHSKATPQPATGGELVRVATEEDASATPNLDLQKASVIRPVVGISYTCNICDRKFERQASLSRHLLLHIGDKKYECDECDQKFSHQLNLDRHKKRVHHLDPSGNHVRCVNCGFWFASSMVLKVHLFSHNPDKESQNWTVEDAIAQTRDRSPPNADEEMKFQCPADNCGRQYDTWLELVDHVSVHGNLSIPNENAAGGGAKKHKCELCFKLFATEMRLNKHMAVHGKEDTKPLQCETCGKRFLTNSALAGHVKIHAEPDHLYNCPICNLEFELMSSLKDHVPTHKVNNQFTCPHCGKVCEQYSCIRKHIRAFHTQKRFSCEICSKTFMGKDKLRQHMIIHSEVKEFCCPHCDKEFKRKDKLRDHMKKIHSSPPKQDTLQTQENLPVKAESNDLDRFLYKCEICKLGFKRRGMLVNHLAKRHPDIPPSSVPELNLPILKTTKDFYCQYCDKVYKSSSKRKAHIQKNHPGKALPISARQVKSDEPTIEERTYSLTVGSVSTQPHSCMLCHKQYASKAKLYQHQRAQHGEVTPIKEDDTASTSKIPNRPDQVLYMDDGSSSSGGTTSRNPSLHFEDSSSADFDARLMVDQSQHLLEPDEEVMGSYHVTEDSATFSQDTGQGGYGTEESTSANISIENAQHQLRDSYMTGDDAVSVNQSVPVGSSRIETRSYLIPINTKPDQGLVISEGELVDQDHQLLPEGGQILDLGPGTDQDLLPISQRQEPQILTLCPSDGASGILTLSAPAPSRSESQIITLSQQQATPHIFSGVGKVRESQDVQPSSSAAQIFMVRQSADPHLLPARQQPDEPQFVTLRQVVTESPSPLVGGGTGDRNGGGHELQLAEGLDQRVVVDSGQRPRILSIGKPSTPVSSSGGVFESTRGAEYHRDESRQEEREGGRSQVTLELVGARSEPAILQSYLISVGEDGALYLEGDPAARRVSEENDEVPVHQDYRRVQQSPVKQEHGSVDGEGNGGSGLLSLGVRDPLQQSTNYLEFDQPSGSRAWRREEGTTVVVKHEVSGSQEIIYGQSSKAASNRNQ